LIAGDDTQRTNVQYSLAVDLYNRTTELLPTNDTEFFLVRTTAKRLVIGGDVDRCVGMTYACM